MKERQYLSLPQCAEKLGISRIAVYKKVKAGKIKAIKVGRSYCVDVQALNQVTARATKQKQGKRDSRIMADDKKDMLEILKSLKPSERLVAFYKHNLLLNCIRQAGIKHK